MEEMIKKMMECDSAAGVRAVATNYLVETVQFKARGECRGENAEWPEKLGESHSPATGWLTSFRRSAAQRGEFITDANGRGYLVAWNKLAEGDVYSPDGYTFIAVEVGGQP